MVSQQDLKDVPTTGLPSVRCERSRFGHDYFVISYGDRMMSVNRGHSGSSDRYFAKLIDRSDRALIFTIIFRESGQPFIQAAFIDRLSPEEQTKLLDPAIDVGKQLKLQIVPVGDAYPGDSGYEEGYRYNQALRKLFITDQDDVLTRDLQKLLSESGLSDLRNIVMHSMVPRHPIRRG